MLYGYAGMELTVHVESALSKNGVFYIMPNIVFDTANKIGELSDIIRLYTFFYNFNSNFIFFLANNFIPHLYLAPPQAVTPSEFREDFGVHKTQNE